MYISRLVIRNFRNFEHLDVPFRSGVTCIIGENNTGKTNLLHAIRLAVDATLSSHYRQMLDHDIHSNSDLTTANQVVVSVEFRDYQATVNECACWLRRGQPQPARIHYRFRPRRAVREAIEADEHDGTHLSLSQDYHFEITGGGINDPATVQWDEELGSALRFGDLQDFQVEFLPALRDVQYSLRQAHESPLGRLLNVSEISDGEKESLVKVLRDANLQIEAQPTFSDTGDAIKKSFADAAGEAFPMSLKLGMADPSFTSIVRSLKVLLSNASLTDFEPAPMDLASTTCFISACYSSIFAAGSLEPEPLASFSSLKSPRRTSTRNSSAFCMRHWQRIRYKRFSPRTVLISVPTLP